MVKFDAVRARLVLVEESADKLRVLDVPQVFLPQTVPSILQTATLLVVTYDGMLCAHARVGSCTKHMIAHETVATTMLALS